LSEEDWPTPENPEYGLLFRVDEEGKRWTLRGDPDSSGCCATLAQKVEASFR
jgi:hypothetical protein